MPRLARTEMKKLLNLGLLISSFFGFLEWGGGRTTFLFQAEAEMFALAMKAPMSVLHPFTLLPVLGQLALLVTLFQQPPGKALTCFGIAGIGILMALMFFIGIIGTNVRILASTLPFLTLSVLALRQLRRVESTRPPAR